MIWIIFLKCGHHGIIHIYFNTLTARSRSRTGLKYFPRMKMLKLQFKPLKPKHNPLQHFSCARSIVWAPDGLCAPLGKGNDELKRWSLIVIKVCTRVSVSLEERVDLTFAFVPKLLCAMLTAHSGIRKRDCSQW